MEWTCEMDAKYEDLLKIYQSMYICMFVMYVYGCVCVYVCVYAYACVCVCVCEREREYAPYTVHLLRKNILLLILCS